MVAIDEGRIGELLGTAGDRLSRPRRLEFQALLDHFVALLSGAFDVPICMVSGFDADLQRVVAGCGLPGEGTFAREDSLCRHPFEAGELLVLPDASCDPAFASNPHVADGLRVRFYAGAPIRGAGGEVAGVLCLVDTRQRAAFGAQQCAALRSAAALVGDALLAFTRRAADSAERELFVGGPTAAVVWDVDDEEVHLRHATDNLEGIIGPSLAARLARGEDFAALVHPEDRIELANALRSHKRSGLKAYELSLRLLEAGGEMRWVRHATRVARGGQGDRTRVFGYLTDETRQKRLEGIVAGTKDRLALAIQSARLGTWDLDMRTQVRLLNARAAEIIGFPLEEVDLHQSFWIDRVHPTDRAALDELIASERTRADGTTSIEYRVRHRQGHYVWVQSFGKVVEVDPSGRPLRAVGTFTDITERREEELQRSRQRGLLDVLNRAHSGFLLTRDLHDACESLFEPLLKLTESRFGFIGIMRRDGAGQPFLLVPTISNISWDEGSRALHESHRDRGVGLRFTNLDNLFGHVVVADTVVCTNDPLGHPASRGFPPGHPKLNSFLGLPMRFDGRVMGMIALGNRPEGFDPAWVQLLEPLASTLGALVHARDLDEAKRRAERALELRASTDALTGLANRVTFIEAAQTAIEEARGHGLSVCIAILDLDHFKAINDTHGHAAGDAALRHFAGVAGRCVRESDLLARIGGEEFGLLLPGTHPGEAARSLERLHEALAAAPLAWGGATLQVRFSAGLACNDAADAGLDAMMMAADGALYAAKAAGRNTTRIADGTPAP